MLRPAEPADGEQLVAITRAGFASYRAFAGEDWQPPADMTDERVAARLATPGTYGVVAEEDGTVVAFAAFSPATDGHDGPPIEDLAHVWAVFAAPSHWGTGAAGAVLAAVVEEIARRGYPEARLFTPAGQARARRFYAREGWTERSEPYWVDALALDIVELRRPI